MATTLYEPKLKIYRWIFADTDVLDFERNIEKAIDEIRGKAAPESIKITWQALGVSALLCIIEWCEWTE